MNIWDPPFLVAPYMRLHAPTVKDWNGSKVRGGGDQVMASSRSFDRSPGTIVTGTGNAPELRVM